MKSAFYIFALLTTCIITIFSCKKGDSNLPTPVQIDSIKSLLPTQFIDTYTFDSLAESDTGDVHIPVTTTDVTSIKYDTTNHRVELYEDDTTNANPYDVLSTTFIFNSSDYLVSYTGYIEAFDSEFGTATINRAADNTITDMVEVSEDLSEVDSIFYTYTSAVGGTGITTISRYYKNNVFGISDTAMYNINADNKLTKANFLASFNYPYEFEASTYTYTYNSNNSIRSFMSQSPNRNINATYTYASGIPDGKADVFLQTLLGKDYYLPGILIFNPFFASVDYDYDLLGVSYTDPYHVTSGTQAGTDASGAYSDFGTWMYELNENKNVSKIVFTEQGTPPETIRIKY